ncbi:MAG: Gfo/Idh/MocA family oxidoreductase [Ferruginibacter sp.]
MKSKRRNFLRSIALGTGSLVTGLPSFANEIIEDSDRLMQNKSKPRPGAFNMSGYAAPKMDKVRIGIIGLGQRGPGAVERMSFIEGVEIKALCDQYPDRVSAAQKILEKKGLPKATEYSGSKEAWKELCNRPDIDLVYITTPWSWHTPMAVYAMMHGKHAASEVPAAKTIEECWQLVETSEKTKKHCMMLENCCYDFFELLTLNMTRNGLFGELVHAEGAYLHDLRELNFSKKGYAEMWRLKENASRNGNIYPTHGLGPVAQCLNINRGDQMDYLVSLSSNDFIMGAIAKERAATDNFYSEFKDKQFRGDMNTSVIKTVKGKTIMVQHDVSSPRPYSRIHLISGTKGIAQKWPDPPKISFGEGWINETEYKALEEKYTLPIVKHMGAIAKNVGGHGGMDFIMDWRLIDCLRNGLPLDQDVYDAALWSSISPLSEKSVANRARSMDVPDFTKGAWKTNQPVNLTLDGGGNTEIRKVPAEGSKQLKIN